MKIVCGGSEVILPDGSIKLSRESIIFNYISYIMKIAALVKRIISIIR
jgi:hypothetical protein